MKIINASVLKYICPWPLWNIHKDNHIFITFDDGPHHQYTISALKILKDYNTKATFFLTGEKIIEFPGVVEKIIKDRHTVGNHGFTHKSLIFKNKNHIHEEIDKTSQAIHNIIGEDPKLFRPPYGWFDFRFKKIMKQKKMIMVLWSLLSYDFRETNSQVLYQRIIQHISPGDIIVFHDGHENAPVMLQILPDVLTWITEKKWIMTGIPV